MVRVLSLLLAACVTACGNPTFVAPDHPIHDKEEGGAPHGRRLDYPFNCGAVGVEDQRGVDCPTARPPDDQLSCDASGCHGNFAFDETQSGTLRLLSGSDGPSCQTCHGVKWKQQAPAVP